MEQIADFPFISANIVDEEGNPVFKPFVIIKRQPFSFGITGITASLPEDLKEVSLADAESSVNSILLELEEQTDFQIVLFNGSSEEAKALRPKFIAADYMFISGVTDNPVGRMKNPEAGPRMYRLGKQGKALGIVTMSVEEPGALLDDITELKLKEEFIQRQITRMKKDNPTKSLHEIYSDDPMMLERANKIQEALDETQRELSGVVNTSRFHFPPMDRSLDDEPQMLGMITETLAACNQLAKGASNNKSTGS